VLGGIEHSPWSPDAGQPSSSTSVAKDIDLLLRFGAYDIFRFVVSSFSKGNLTNKLYREDDNTSTKFCEEEIDSILQRAKVVRYDSGANSSGATSSFSKVIFSLNAIPLQAAY